MPFFLKTMQIQLLMKTELVRIANGICKNEDLHSIWDIPLVFLVVFI